MKNKNIIISVLAVVILAIVALIIYAFVGNNKDKKKDTKKDNKKKETKYELKEQYHNDLVINNIEIELVEDQTIVSFSITNKGSEVYPEGIITFSIEAANVPAEQVTTNTSAINPNETIDMEIVINGTYDNIDAINVVE